MSEQEQDEAAREAAYLENITKRKQQKFSSKVFGGGLEAAREGKANTVHHNVVQHTPVQQHHAPVQPKVHQPVKKTWNQPIQETVQHEPIHRTTSQRSYGEIDTTSTISKRADDDIEEALRKEEERMNKKLSSTAPVGSIHVGGLQSVNSPERRTGSQSYPQSSQNYSKLTPVHAHNFNQPNVSNSCTCGHISPQGTKFCSECGKLANTGPSSQTYGYSQNIAPTGRYGEIDQTPMTSKRDDSDLEEALRREEERVNKKVGNTAGSANFGGSTHQQQQSYQHQPAHQSVHAQTKPQFKITEDIVEEVVLPVKNMNIGMKGPGVFCTFDIPGNPSGDDRPKMSVDQSSSYLFTPVPAKLGCTVECIIEGTDVIKFKMTTTQGSVIVQKYSMPFPIGREMLKRKGDSVELDPF